MKSPERFTKETGGSGGRRGTGEDGGCPSESDLLEYAAGKASPGLEAAIRDHLEECADCAAQVLTAVRALAASAAAGDTQPTRAPIWTTPQTLEVGDVILDRYRVTRFVARGGMGEVYEAHDTLLNEVVALKTLVCTELDSEAARKDFLAEVRHARQVTHPNVCRILEFGFHTPRRHSGASPEHIPFLTMEFLRGETLAQRIARKGRLEPAVVASLLPQIVAGMSAIHDNGIVHRDIKPQNIVILPGSPERVVVTDFGLARALDVGAGPHAETGPVIVGTIDYMAPEQIESKAPNPRFDVFALGVVIFEMLTGHKPFSGHTAADQAAARVGKPLPRPSETVRGLDSRWDKLVLGCLTLDPDKRLARVEDIVAPPVRRWSPAARGAAWALGGAALVVLAGVAFLGLSGGSKSGLGDEPAPEPIPAAELAAALARRPPGAPPPRPVSRTFAASGCSADMVAVAGRFCIDRYEATTVDDVEERPLSPFYPPYAPNAQAVRDYWQDRWSKGKSGSDVQLPTIPPYQREDRWRPRAVSQGGVTPQGNIDRLTAAAACSNAGKRLCTETEWKTACRGQRGTKFPYGPEFKAGACNVVREAHPALLLHGAVSAALNDPRLNMVGYNGKPLLRVTGVTEQCASTWGSDAIYDMVGNLDEWVDTPNPVYLGGFYSRETRDGCDYRNDRHVEDGPSYFNYSLGFRCCDGLRNTDGSPP